ncbi:MAG TPA: HAD family hydrolase [Planctomycetota bacterium]|nr:HAD family hydrolase [Planctomycetota bacterium]
MIPKLLTFDIFGTVVDWRSGLLACVPSMSLEDFEEAIDRQGALEKAAPGRRYSEIVAQDLEERGVPRERAAKIGSEVGKWPVFSDSREGMRRLMALAPCCAMTNSDRVHGEQVQAQLGFELTHWIPAEEVKVYKPSPDFWRAVSRKLAIAPGKEWWHVSAYADYDLEVARGLGLTTVFVARPHSRRGRADLEVRDLVELSQRLRA